MKDDIKEKFFFPDLMLRPSREQLPPDIRIVPIDRTLLKYRSALESIAAGTADPSALAVDALREVESDPGERLSQ